MRARLPLAAATDIATDALAGARATAAAPKRLRRGMAPGKMGGMAELSVQATRNGQRALGAARLD